MKRLFVIALACLAPAGCSHLHRGPSNKAPVTTASERSVERVETPLTTPSAKPEPPEVADRTITPVTKPASFVAKPTTEDRPVQPVENAAKLDHPGVGETQAKAEPTDPMPSPTPEPVVEEVAPRSPASAVAMATSPLVLPDLAPPQNETNPTQADLTAMPTLEVPESVPAEVAATPAQPLAVADPLPTPSTEPTPAASPTVEAPPTVVTPQGPVAVVPQPKGRAVARVGDEVITLPTLTDAVKRRLQLVPTDSPPTRKLIIRVARSTLEFLIEKSLISQEAQRRFPVQDQLEAAMAEADGHWPMDELPRLLRREGVASEAELRGKLARRGQSLDDLREIAKLRALALSMMAKSGMQGNLEGYLGQLRKQTPITSIMTPTQLAASQGDPSAKARLAGGRGE